MSSNKKFFMKQKAHSWVKTEIVTKYFAVWSQIISRQMDKPVIYMDLFSGPGIFHDGNRSTPLRILDSIDEITPLQKRIQLNFYETDEELHTTLCGGIRNHPVFGKLRFAPELHNTKVNEELISKLPAGEGTFSFVDPYGYKGVSLNLLNALLNNWGSDCLFYLSIHGIRRNIKHNAQVSQIEDLLGEGSVEKLRQALSERHQPTPFYRLVMNELTLSLSRARRSYVLPFRVEQKGGVVTHLLVFVTKHWLGFRIMKDIMAEFSHKHPDGFPSYCFTGVPQEELALYSPMVDLANSFSKRFSGGTYKVSRFLEMCHAEGCIYREADIKKSLIWLENAKRIEVDKPISKRMRKGAATLGPDRQIRFA